MVLDPSASFVPHVALLFDSRRSRRACRADGLGRRSQGSSVRRPEVNGSPLPGDASCMVGSCGPRAGCATKPRSRVEIGLMLRPRACHWPRTCVVREGLVRGGLFCPWAGWCLPPFIAPSSFRSGRFVERCARIGLSLVPCRRTRLCRCLRRSVLILGRELGLELREEDVTLEPVLEVSGPIIFRVHGFEIPDTG